MKKKRISGGAYLMKKGKKTDAARLDANTALAAQESCGKEGFIISYDNFIMKKSQSNKEVTNPDQPETPVAHRARQTGLASETEGAP